MNVSAAGPVRGSVDRRGPDDLRETLSRSLGIRRAILPLVEEPEIPVGGRKIRVLSGHRLERGDQVGRLLELSLNSVGDSSPDPRLWIGSQVAQQLVHLVENGLHLLWVGTVGSRLGLLTRSDRISEGLEFRYVVRVEAGVRGRGQLRLHAAQRVQLLTQRAGFALSSREDVVLFQWIAHEIEELWTLRGPR